MNANHKFLSVGTGLLIILAVFLNAVGNFFLSLGMHQVGEMVSPVSYIAAFLNLWVIAGVGLLSIWIISQLSLLSRVDLSYVLSVTSFTYVLAAILGNVFLHEQISILRWAGILSITFGVMLVGQTAPHTTGPQPARDGQ
jgi:uncharacterized membrane protein